MLLRNYDNLVAGLLTIPYNSSTGSDASVFGDGYLNFKDIGGTVRSIYNNINYYPSIPFGMWHAHTPSPLSYVGGSSLIVGAGTTAPTYEDYMLDSQITVTYSNLVQGTPTYNASTGKWEETVTVDFYNDTESTLTINEIGIVKSTRYASSSTQYALIAREVLTSPVSVSAGAYGRVSFTYEVPSNPNKP